jgi:TRAP-type C4-dicarboxylate transport system permease small subunit
MALVVFYQVYTRYVLSDSAGWTEEIARYFLVAVVFIGASMSVRKNNHIQVDYFYRLMPKAMGRVLSDLRRRRSAACSSATPLGSPGSSCNVSAASAWR